MIISNKKFYNVILLVCTLLLVVSCDKLDYNKLDYNDKRLDAIILIGLIPKSIVAKWAVYKDEKESLVVNIMENDPVKMDQMYPEYRGKHPDPEGADYWTGTLNYDSAPCNFLKSRGFKYVYIYKRDKKKLKLEIQEGKFLQVK